MSDNSTANESSTKRSLAQLEGESPSPSVPSSSASANQAISALLTVSLHTKTDDEVIDGINAIAAEHGHDSVLQWRSSDKHQHCVLHVLVNSNKQAAIKSLALLTTSQLNAQRASDLCTPLHLSAWKKQIELTKVLLEAGADPLVENKYGENCQKLQDLVKRSSTICFLDLELSQLGASSDGSGTILEIAIVVTDSDLVEIDRKQWVVSKPAAQMEQLSVFHQQTYVDVSKGGNGLFAAIQSESALPIAQVNTEVLEFVLAHCPEKCCPLAGFSVHCDREVLGRDMPAVYAHLSHQIIDVSTMLQLASRWQPDKILGKPTREASQVAHRAMGDVEYSIETLRFLRQNFFA